MLHGLSATAELLVCFQVIGENGAVGWDVTLNSVSLGMHIKSKENLKDLEGKSNDDVDLYSTQS